MNLTEAIRLIKRETGLSQAEIAERLGYSRTYLSTAMNSFPSDKLAGAIKKEFNKEVFTEDISTHNDEPENYLIQRMNSKIDSGPLMVSLVPVVAQAGYSKRYTDTQYLRKLETYPIVPGIDPHGAIWRYFQVSGESMQDFLHDGDYVLASQVPNEDWGEDFKNFMAYVIVTDDLVTVKYVAKRKDEFILIPVNEKFDQQAIKIDTVKEIWKYRRHIGWNASRPEKLKIKI